MTGTGTAQASIQVFGLFLVCGGRCGGKEHTQGVGLPLKGFAGSSPAIDRIGFTCQAIAKASNVQEAIVHKP